jgi:cytochrome c-type biogenesis protein
VLAGVMTLSALSGSAGGGIVLGLAYVFGMVFPLFVMALLWDRARLGERKLFRARLVKIRLGSRVLVTNTLNLAVAIAFTIMGAFVISLAGSPDMTGGTATQAAMGEGLAEVFGRVQTWLSPVPEPVLGLALLAVAAVFVVATLRDRRRPAPRTDSAPDHHETTTHEGLPR